MSNRTTAAILAAGALTVAMPRSVFASPRADAPTDPKAQLALIQTAFAELKETNEAALKSKADDTLVNAKMDAINADLNKLVNSLDEQAKKITALTVGGGGGGNALSPEAAEHAKVFNSWFRKGDRAIDANLRELEVNAKLTTQSDPDGGYLVPVEMDGTIDRVLGTVSAIRGISRKITISGQVYKKLVNMGGATSGWVGEQSARTETSTPTLREIALQAFELYAQPGATQTVLDDAAFDVAAWLADEVSIEFAEQEGEAFVAGNGVNKPRGFMAYDTIANANWAWGKVGFVKTGHATAFIAPTSELSPCDALIDLYYALRAPFRNGATFVTSDAVMGTIRKFKDGQGNYIWAPPTGVDMPATILGKPVVTDDNMPALGAGNFPVAFGNFQRGYTVVDRQGTRVLRDPFTSKPNVLFYTTKRVGGGITNFEAIKLLKCSA